LRNLNLPILLLLLFAVPPLWGQGNPFELTARLPDLAVVTDSGRVVVTETGNPFDLRPGVATSAAPTFSAVPLNGAEVQFDRLNASPAAAPRNGTDRARRGPLVIQSTDPNKGKGSILAIHIILLLALAGLWLTFGDLLRQCLRSTLNDGLMNQLYTRRSGGELGALWACYIFFFLAGGFFIYLTTTRFNVSTGIGIWGSWLTYSLVVAAGLGLKNLVLVLYSRLFPVQREVSRYVFAIMVFSILAGLFIAPINLLVSYAPEGFQDGFIYGGLAIFGIIYFLHLFRGVFIANRLLASRPVHILLYVCTIEIAPLLLIYRYLSDTLV
jgi:hypothetical protein